MNPVIYAIALVSFFAGSFGYVLVRFVLLPLWRYRRIRGRIAALLAAAGPAGRPDRRAGELRRLSAALSDCFNDQLPHWYRLYLTGRRGHSPAEASGHLLALANTREAAHAERRQEKIEQCLGIRRRRGDTRP